MISRPLSHDRERSFPVSVIPSPRSGRRGSAESGSITVFFCIFALVLMGALSYSLYVGQQVERREVLQTAADAATVSVANHASTGVNMIAANNLAVASSIHIGGSVAILAAYGSLARAAGYDFIDTFEDVVTIVASGTTNIQSDIWDPLSHVTGVFLRAASGLTTFNDVLAKVWFVGGTLRGVEVARLNVPGSVGLPVMRAGFSPLLLLKGVKRSQPEETVCHAIKGSKALEKSQRDSFVRWLTGPFLTLNVGVVNQILSVLAKIQDVAHAVMPVRIGFHRCGYGVKISLLDALDLFGNAAGGGADRKNTIESAASDATLQTDEIGEIGDSNEAMIEFNAFGGQRAQDCYRKYSQALQNDVVKKALDQPNSAQEKAVFAASSLRQMSSATHTSRCQETDAQGQPVGPVRYGMETYRDPSSGRMLCRKPQNPTQSASCQPLDASGKNSGPSVKDAVPFKDPATNRTECLRLAPGYSLQAGSPSRFIGEPDEVWWGCPLVPFLQFKHARTGLASGNTCGEAEVIHDALLEVRCAGYRKLRTSKVDPNDSDDGLNIAQWSSQAKQYAEAHTDAKDTLGFIYPDPSKPDDLEDSLTYLTMLADPIRTPAELKTGTCPAEMTTHVDGKEYCTQSGMLGFHRSMDAAARNALDGRQRADANLMSGGMNEALRDAASARGQLSALAEGNLTSTFSRLQWTVAQSKAFYDASGDDPTPGNVSGTFFWPAWRSRLIPSDLIGEALKFLSTSKDAKGLDTAKDALE